MSRDQRQQAQQRMNEQRRYFLRLKAASEARHMRRVLAMTGRHSRSLRNEFVKMHVHEVIASL